MSADRLREAARVLRERAQEATPGPWVAYADGVIEGASANRHVGRVKSWNVAYVATIDPAVGLALSSWLEAEASELTRNHPTLLVRNALSVADAILGDRS